MTGTLARGAVQYFCAQTLDGFIAEADGGIQWLSGPTPEPLFGCEMEGARAEGDSYEEFFAQVGALAMGRDTYEGVVSHYPKKWPYGLEGATSAAPKGRFDPCWKRCTQRRTARTSGSSEAANWPRRSPTKASSTNCGS
jgi:dihydrofolate reductase